MSLEILPTILIKMLLPMCTGILMGHLLNKKDLLVGNYNFKLNILPKITVKQWKNHWKQHYINTTSCD